RQVAQPFLQRSRVTTAYDVNCRTLGQLAEHLANSIVGRRVARVALVGAQGSVIVDQDERFDSGAQALAQRCLSYAKSTWRRNGVFERFFKPIEKHLSPSNRCIFLYEVKHVA